jgi:hypothetical protein
MEYWYLYDLYQRTRGESDFSGTQYTVSEGHPISRLGKTGEDIGGDFYTFKSEVTYLSHRDVFWFPPNYKEDGWSFQGPVTPPGTAPIKREELNLRSIQELNALGATAISRCSPVNSHSEVLTSLAETLKDGLPAIPGIPTWQNRTAKARGAGSEYLNAQFGWIPLVSDIQNAVRAARDSAKILDQFKRDAGRVVRRRYEFPKEVVKTRVREYEGNGAGTAAKLATGVLQNSHFYGGDESGRYYTDRETTTKVWFSGAFTYHMPADSTQVGKFMSALQQYDLLFGVGLTPDVVWNLTPWSWATDWFANTGDVLTNISNAALYGQVLRYGYLMEQTTIIDRNTLELPNCKIGTRFESATKTVVKRRIQANPFGFGLTFDGLDAYQWSILAALGLTKGRGARRE